MADSSLQEQLRKYLTDAHSIEEQALAQLEVAPRLAGDAELARIFQEHLGETRGHESMTRARLEALGADTSTLKDAVMDEEKWPAGADLGDTQPKWRRVELDKTLDWIQAVVTPKRVFGLPIAHRPRFLRGSSACDGLRAHCTTPTR